METANKSVDIEIQMTKKEDILFIYASGSLIYQTIPSAKKQTESLDLETKNYLFDMSLVTKVDSTGFGFILNVIKRIPKASRLVVVLTDSHIIDLFQITKVNQLVDIYDNQQTAIDSFKKIKE